MLSAGSKIRIKPDQGISDLHSIYAAENIMCHYAPPLVAAVHHLHHYVNEEEALKPVTLRVLSCGFFVALNVAGLMSF